MEQTALYVWNHLPMIPGEAWRVVGDMAPWLLLGFAVAGVLSQFISATMVERHLGGHGFWPVFKAAAIGVPLPLCSCGVIPVAASLRKHGASRGATTAFLISTPETGVDSIAVTYSMLGGVFAVFRVVASLVSGMIAGLLTDLLIRDKADKPATVAPSADCCNSKAPAPAADCCHAAKPAPVADCCQSKPLTPAPVADCCHSEAPAAPPADCCKAAAASSSVYCTSTDAGPTKSTAGRLGRALEFGFITMPRDLAWSLVIGLLVAAAISEFAPPDSFKAVLGGGVVAIILMMLLGVPIYVCATASVPMAWAMIDKGASPGAAFAFLVAGPATNAATVAVVWKTMGWRTCVIYLSSIAVGAVGGGLLLDMLLPAGLPLEHMGMAHIHNAGGAMPMPNVVAAVVLLGLLAWALFGPHISKLVRRS